MKQAVPYYRVSTDRQGESGLGLDAQQHAIKTFAAVHGYRLLSGFTEIESGADKARPILQKALQACRKHKAVLVIAKLDRLSRNVAFISNLMESEIEFIAVDSPWVEDLYLHIQAAFAQHERMMNSRRTKAALAQAKLRGVQLGRFGKEVLSRRNRQASLDFALALKPLIEELRGQGFQTIRQLRDELNRRRVATFHGNGHRWHIGTVHRLFRHYIQESKTD
jgi:DNA invertase Pin-like site-specific DNA recombinase